MRLPERSSVVVIGAGQAGLSISWHLTRDGIDHVVLDRGSMFNQWQDARWDSFCLVTPNWQCQLPGYAYTGTDPDGFMVKSELLEWLAGYPASFGPPVIENVLVSSVRPADGGGYRVQTSQGAVTAQQVVVATGGYHTPNIPRMAERLPASVTQLHSSTYKNPESLPPGPVLVVGTGQSGSQIAEDLQLAGRTVHLAVGTAPRVARFYRGRDVVAWLQDMGHYDKPVTDQPVEERHRDRTNHYLTGRDGGRDIDLRAFAANGMRLHGHLTGIAAGRLRFAPDLQASLDGADAVYNGINAAVDAWITAQGIDAPPPSTYTPVWQPSGTDPGLDGGELAAVVWATGFTKDYRWLHVPVFDGAGYPQHLRGVTAQQGLYFIGLPWLHTWGSGRFAAIARDAGHVASVLKDAHTEPLVDA